jgi:hypothetical protein
MFAGRGSTCQQAVEAGSRPRGVLEVRVLQYAVRVHLHHTSC